MKSWRARCWFAWANSPDREGLLNTPERYAKALQYLTKGYREDPEQILKGALFSVDYDEMVIVKDIEMFSLCEHHVLPFFGKVHVAYIPKGKVIGLSKVPRLVEVFARRLQVQERLTVQIAETIQKSHSAAGRRRGDRGAPPVHDDARRREATFGHGHLVHAGRVSRAADAAGIPLAHPRQERQRNLIHGCEEAAVERQAKTSASVQRSRLQVLACSAQVAVVTGGSRGIGYAIAGALAAEGCSVVITGRDPAKLAKSAAELSSRCRTDAAHRRRSARSSPRCATCAIRSLWRRCSRW